MWKGKNASHIYTATTTAATGQFRSQIKPVNSSDQWLRNREHVKPPPASLPGDMNSRACQQPACQALFCARRRMAKYAFELGAFCLPDPFDIESVVLRAIAQA